MELDKRIYIIGNLSRYFEDLKEIANDAGFEALDFYHPEEMLGGNASREISFLIALGDSSLRKELYETTITLGFEASRALVHPSASVSRSVHLGVGTHINRLTSIASNTSISINCQINRSCSIGHHVEISDHTSFGPGVIVSGGSVIGSRVLLGAGATILPGVSIGQGAIVGAGEVVTKSIPENSTVMGNPARISN